MKRIKDAERQSQMETHSQVSLEQERQREVNFNQQFGPLSCRLMCVHLRKWHNFTDGFDPLCVRVMCLFSRWTQSRDLCEATKLQQHVPALEESHGSFCNANKVVFVFFGSLVFCVIDERKEFIDET